mgnify:CR=1 FL=1
MTIAINSYLGEAVRAIVEPRIVVGGSIEFLTPLFPLLCTLREYMVISHLLNRRSRQRLFHVHHRFYACICLCILST